MAERPKKSPEQAPKKSGGKGAKQGLIIGFIVVLLGINGTQLYLWYEQKQQKAADDKQIAEQKVTIDEKSSEVDSLLQQIELRIQEKIELEGNVEELLAAKEELLVLNQKFKKDAKNAAIYYRKWKEMKNQYEPMLRNQDEEIAQLKARAEELNNLNTELKEEKVVLTTNIKELESENAVKADSIRMAQVLQADKFKVTAVKKNGKEKFAELYKAKELVKAKIEFEIDKNPVAPIGGRELYIQIKDPSGATLNDISGGGKFNADNKEMFYTLKDSFNYQRSKAWRTLYFENDTPFTTGEYSIVVYADKERIGSGTFTVK